VLSFFFHSTTSPPDGPLDRGGVSSLQILRRLQSTRLGTLLFTNPFPLTTARMSGFAPFGVFCFFGSRVTVRFEGRPRAAVVFFDFPTITPFPPSYRGFNLSLSLACERPREYPFLTIGSCSCFQDPPLFFQFPWKGVFFALESNTQKGF